jgi:hypothetical protein
MEFWGRTTVRSMPLTAAAPHTPAEASAVLRELFELLEDYAPIWYTEDLHNRAAAALGELQPAM